MAMMMIMMTLMRTAAITPAMTGIVLLSIGNSVTVSSVVGVSKDGIDPILTIVVVGSIMSVKTHCHGYRKFEH